MPVYSYVSSLTITGYWDLDRRYQFWRFGLPGGQPQYWPHSLVFQPCALADYRNPCTNTITWVPAFPGGNLSLGFTVCTILPVFQNTQTGQFCWDGDRSFHRSRAASPLSFAPNVYSSSDAYDRVKNACFCVFRNVCSCSHLVNLSSWASLP